LHDAGSVDTLTAEILNQCSTSFVVADDAHGEDTRAQDCQIVHGIRRAAGISLSAAVTKNQNGSFARNTRNFAGYKFVEDEIADDADCLARERRDDVKQACEIDTAVSSRSGGPRGSRPG
jgi:hypothetical protein